MKRNFITRNRIIDTKTIAWALGLSVTLALSMFATLPSSAEDWPTYQHDNYRSGMTSETLDLQQLKQKWVYQSPNPPQTAWFGPAKWDAYANINGLKSMRNYDPVFYTIVVDQSLYFGSSADDSVHCLDAVTGEERWFTVTGGPVRVAPAYSDGKIYFGSDDGHAYCADSRTGDEIWKYAPAPLDNMVPNNGKLIPLWPCRSGVLIDGGIAYFTAALLPWKDSYLCAVDAKTGEREGERLFQITRNRATMEGALLASASKLYVPQGRRAPMIFDRADGKYLGSLEGGGGVFAFLTKDAHFFHGPGNKAGWITESNAETKDTFAKFDNAVCMMVSGQMAYVVQNDLLFAMDRDKRQILWRVNHPSACSLMMAGKTLFVGGDYGVSAYRPSDGERVWNAPVEGKAYGLTAANGGLFVSTSTGAIYAFR